MSVKRCNIEGVMDSLFREFLSQPGERQYCSELLRSISKGEKVETKDFLKIPNGSSTRGSPKGSPLGSPRNLALLSPIFLPPSPRSPTATFPPVSPLSHSEINNVAQTNLSSRLSDCAISSPVSSRQTASHTHLLKRHTNHDFQNTQTTETSCCKSSQKNFMHPKSLDTNFNTIEISSRQSLRNISKGQMFSFVFNEAMGLSRVSHHPVTSVSKKQFRRLDIVPSPPSPPRTLETNPTPTPPPPLTAFKQTNLKESLAAVSIANKENARPLSSTTNSLGSPPSISPHSSSPIPSSAISSPCSPSSPLGLGGTGLASPIATRAPGRRLPKTPKNILIPRFYYPLGRPMPQSSQEQSLERVEQCFREHGGQITRENMEPLMRACQLPLYWKAPLFIAAGGEKLGHLTEEQFIDYWNRLISSCHDSYSRFIRILNRGLRSYLLPEDFLALIQDVVDTHPGLTFLKEATEFHSRYVHTVIARIYYCVNRSWSGKITIPELRRSNLLQVISYLEEEEDINKITDYFSYEHFYVIYCKFWELDTDHDLFIDRNDLAKHNDRALSDKIIDRIFSGAVTRGRAHKQDRMGYQEFVWFLISEEDKRHPTAIEYWFRCMDLDGDGYLSMYELEYFYEDQLQRMEALGIETLPFTDCLCQMLDMVRPAEHGRISLSDLKKCRMTPVFYDTFFNFDKYLDHEQRDPFASHRLDDEGPEISDWDRYAAVEYELLVAEEGGGDSQDDMLYGDEDELSMGVDNVLDGSDCELGVIGSELGVMSGSGGLKKHANLSATVPNLALDQMEVDDDYSDYADSDDYQY